MRPAVSIPGEGELKHHGDEARAEVLSLPYKRDRNHKTNKRCDKHPRNIDHLIKVHGILFVNLQERQEAGKNRGQAPQQCVFPQHFKCRLIFSSLGIIGQKHRRNIKHTDKRKQYNRPGIWVRQEFTPAKNTCSPTCSMIPPSEMANIVENTAGINKPVAPYRAM